MTLDTESQKESPYGSTGMQDSGFGCGSKHRPRRLPPDNRCLLLRDCLVERESVILFVTRPIGLLANILQAQQGSQ